MKKINALSIVLLLAMLLAGIARINTVKAVENTQGQALMGQMMGNNYDSMDKFMDQMMGTGGSDSIYRMMDKIGEKGITAEDMKPMAQFMSACQARGGGSYMYNMMGNLGNAMGYGLGIGGAFLLFGWLIMIIFWIIVILGAVALIKWLIREVRGEGGETGRALDILKEKYAKGEISKEEFEAKKKDLT